MEGDRHREQVEPPTLERRWWSWPLLFAGPIVFLIGAAFAAPRWISAVSLFVGLVLLWEVRRQLTTRIDSHGVTQTWFVRERRIAWSELCEGEVDVAGRLYLTSQRTRIDIDTRGLANAEAIVRYCWSRWNERGAT